MVKLKKSNQFIDMTVSSCEESLLPFAGFNFGI